MCAYKVNAHSSIRDMQMEASTRNTQIIFVDMLLGEGTSICLELNVLKKSLLLCVTV